jgi:CRP/FNR family transcriptional regulator, cyclic AMP receptor protein
MLSKIPLFANLEPDIIQRLQDATIPKRFARNTILFSKGDESNALYMIREGRTKAVITDDQGKEIVLNTFGPGDYFGEIAFLSEEPRTATVVTTSPTEVLILYRRDFKEVLTKHPDVMFEFIKVLIDRVRNSTEQIESLAFHDVYGRVRALLNGLAREEGEKRIIVERLTHQEIANRVGSSREMVSKIFKQLQDGGFVAVDHKQVVLLRDLPKTF